MKNVWPTVGVLKALNKGSKLSPAVKAEYDAASAANEPEVKIGYLVQAVELARKDDPLLADARKGFADGIPSLHKAMSKSAGIPVYEVRDYQGAAWRGAVVCPDKDTDAWLIHVDYHDRFHQTGPDVMANKKSGGNLGPSELDKRIRTRCVARNEDRRAQKEVLRGLIDALQAVTNGNEKAQIIMPLNHSYQNAVITVSVCPIIDEEDNALESHEQLSSIRLEFSTHSMDYKMRDDLLRICAPFLQPDESLIEPIYRHDLIVEIVVTQARFIYLLGVGEDELIDYRRSPSEPTVLHYTSKNGLTEAYVEGYAVQAVCGQWWIPTGDEQTHAHLSVCPECEAEEPFAQALAHWARKGNGSEGAPTTDC